MTLNLIRRPQKPIAPGIDSIFTAGSSPVVYRFEREDFQISFIGPSITDPGFYQVNLAGEHTEEIFLGTLIHINGLDTATGNRIFISTTSVIAIAFNGGTNETEISVDEPFFGVIGDAGICNNLSRTNYFVEVQIVVTETGRELFTTRLKYFPTIIGTVIVDLSPLVNSFLDSDTPYDSNFYTVPNHIQPLSSFNFYITYQERFDGSLTGPIDDSGNPQIVTNSVRQILQAASPNMAPFVPFSGDLLQLMENPNFETDITPWQNIAPGWGTWTWAAGDRVGIFSVANPEGSRSVILTQDLLINTGPVLWHESINPIQVTVNVENPGMIGFLEFVDIDDDKNQEEFTPGILRNPDGTIKENKVEITFTDFRVLNLLYQPSQNATRIGVRVISAGIDSIIVNLESFTLSLPERKYLHRDGDLVLWRGFPFSVSWIYSDLVIGPVLESVEVWNDINGNPVDTIIREIDAAGALKINTQSFKQDEFITSELPSNVFSIDATIRIQGGAKIIETKRIQVLEPCDNPVYLQWVNAFGGLDYWLFDHNQELSNQIIEGRKFKQILAQAENITEIEYQALDYLNHPGQITDIRRVDPDFTIQDKTARRQGTQAYILDNDQSGDKKGILLQPFVSPINRVDTTHKIQIRFLMPEEFVTQ